MGSEKQMKVSKRFGFNLRPFQKVTLRQIKKCAKSTKIKHLKRNQIFRCNLILKRVCLFYMVGSKRNICQLFFSEVSREKGSGPNMISFLERRLDTVLVKNHFAESFAHARQLISHQKIKVNGVYASAVFSIIPGGSCQCRQRSSKSMR